MTQSHRRHAGRPGPLAARNRRRSRTPRPARDAPTWRWVPIRSLGPRHHDRIVGAPAGPGDHDRYLRFGYPATDAQIAKYVDMLDFEQDEVFGIFNRRLELIALAHLAHAASGRRRRPGTMSEFGVSVLPQGARARLRLRGCSSMRCCMLATAACETLFIHALSENTAMLKIARKAGATVERDGSESEAWLQSAAGHARLARRTVGRRAGRRIDYQLKVQASRVSDLMDGISEVKANIGAAAHIAGRVGSAPVLGSAHIAVRDHGLGTACVTSGTVSAEAAWIAGHRSRTPCHTTCRHSVDHRAGRRGGLRAGIRRVLVADASATRSRPRCPRNGASRPRPVFSTDERRVYRLLREALPHHIVLSKLPLVRFCQPTDPAQVRYWFDLLGCHPRDLRRLQRERPRAGGDRPRHRTWQLAARVCRSSSRCWARVACATCAARSTTCPRSPNCSCWCRRPALLRVGRSAGDRLPTPLAPPGARHALAHRRHPARRAHGAVAGLSAVPGFVLRARQPRDGFGSSEFTARFPALVAERTARRERAAAATPSSGARRRRRGRRSHRATRAASSRRLSLTR